MAMQFDVRLSGHGAPDGELDADDLVALVESLREVASKIGRVETRAHPAGRPPSRTRRVARLMVGLAAGSTTVRVHRAGLPGALDFELAEERMFDETFAGLVDGIARNHRPAWVGDPLALATAHLVSALRQAAPRVEFAVDRVSRGAVETASLHRDLWQVPLRAGPEEVSVVGRLYSANLHSHRFRLEDAVGTRIVLPSVVDDSAAARLLDALVVAVGVPEYDADGGIAAIRNATISPAADVSVTGLVPSGVPIEEILASAPGPGLEHALDLTDEEFDSFLRAVRG